ncbi:MAG: sigma-70 family RNA polymerase sigma factor [Ferruginibacter sp.]
MQEKALKEDFVKKITGHELLIYKICRLYAYTDADRQDLFQEIVIQLWRAFPGYRADAAFSTWMYRVAINTSISGLRKKKIFSYSVEPGNLPTQISDVSYNYENEEKLQMLYSAIGKLNEIEKALVMLYLEDRSYNEIEEILGITEGALRVKMSRIKEKLRSLTNN